MRPISKQQLIDALRSGKYKQGSRYGYTGTEELGFTPISLACYLAGADWRQEDEAFPMRQELHDLVPLDKLTQYKVLGMHSGGTGDFKVYEHHTFNEIADFLDGKFVARLDKKYHPDEVIA